jgi:hypothetical protein
MKNPICPNCEIPMVRKTNKKTGDEFFGCPNFPDAKGGCRETKSIDWKELEGAESSEEEAPTLSGVYEEFVVAFEEFKDTGKKLFRLLHGLQELQTVSLLHQLEEVAQDVTPYDEIIPDLPEELK